MSAENLRLPLSGVAAARLGALAASMILLIAILRMGWVSDDSFITIRSVDHLVRGRGFVLNLGERVQSYTSPLWALLCVPFFALKHDPYFSLIAPGIACSLGVVLLVLRAFRRSPWKAVVTLLALSASLSFVHFSTSGLENSLAHLLATLFVCERLQNGREPTRACFAIAAGLFLTRFDFALLCAPSLCLISFKNGRRSLRMAWPALAAGSAWLLFATVYYGFPLPNTAYAKLNTGIPRSEQLAQGLAYLVDSACRDPIVLTTLGVAGLLVTLKGTPAVARALLVGVGAYVLYVVYLGGDFMSGRYLTTCYIISVLVAVHLAEPLHSWALPAAAAALVPFVTSGFSDRRADPVRTECSIPSSGIVDERECYVEHTGLAQNIRQSKWKTHGYLQEFENAASATPDRFLVFNLVGMASYANREERHIVERFALTEPLLARIRVKPEPTWRIGHFLRPLPDGYLETLRSGKNVIAPQCLHNLFDRLALVTHGPLWRTDRLAAILSLNITHPICNAP